MEIKRVFNDGLSYLSQKSGGVKPNFDDALTETNKLEKFESVKDDAFLKKNLTENIKMRALSVNSFEEPVSLSASDLDFDDISLMPKDLYQVDSSGKSKKVTFVYDPEGRSCLKNLKVVGSWDKNTGRYTNQWKQSALPMKMDDKGRWIATVDLMDDSPHDWQWGVVADSPLGKQKWAVFEEGNLKFNMGEENPKAFYAPTTFKSMGASRQGKDIGFKFWAPNAKNVRVRAWGDDESKAEYVPLSADKNTGIWNAQLPDAWDRFADKNYAYEVTTSDGRTVLKNDPYARAVQGIQRGIDMIYLHPVKGKEVHFYQKDPDLEKEGKKSWEKFLRFEVQGYERATDVYLTFTDENGNVMTKEALVSRLTDKGGDLVEKFHDGKFNDFWLPNMDDRNRIRLTRQGGAWAAIVSNPDGVAGLKYKFEACIKKPDGSVEIIGDKNRDGVLSSEEARKSNYNDPFSDFVSAKFEWPRYGVIKDTQFAWKNDSVKRVGSDKNKMVIYQAHVGSIFGEANNVKRSTFKDITDRLDYFKDRMHANTIEILPANSFEDSRDWGYIGTSTFAVSENYGFVDDDGKWVNGAEAFKRFVDAAHGKGLNVLNDVVYNHWAGKYNNLWEIDGPKNEYFQWADGKGVRDTDWGPMPAYDKKQVRQFIIDNAVAQMDEFHVDGLRFDFTNPIHNVEKGGGEQGWTLLRTINKQIHFFHPDSVTSAEEFPNSEIVTSPVSSNSGGGAGFDNMWNTEFQHRLVHGWGNAVLQQAVNGHKTDMNNLMEHILHPAGFSNYKNSVTVITNHDEVGNADRTINIAKNYQERLPASWERGAAKMTFGVGMLSPGIAIYFQGEESLATNRFKWGVASTWDVGWDWMNVGKDWNWNQVSLDDANLGNLLSGSASDVDGGNSSLTESQKKVGEYLSSFAPGDVDGAKMNIYRKAHNNFCADVTDLRYSAKAFESDASVKRVYVNDSDSVMAFSRNKGDEEYLVISSLNKNNLSGYKIPLEGGKWRLMLNSDSKAYGGAAFGGDCPFDKKVDESSRLLITGDYNSRFDLPAAGVLVFKRVE